MSFIWKRLHSILGIFLVVYLTFHLFTNSQAALFLDSDGRSFILEVNKIHDIPYLIVFEILLLGLPFLIHMIWGINYLLRVSINSNQSDGSKPSLPFWRNRAYTWQRISSWILILGVVAHVVHMRIVRYPESVEVENQTYYLQHVTPDPGLATVAKRLDATLVTEGAMVEGSFVLPRHRDDVVVVAKNFGTATLFLLRDSFKNLWVAALYTLFVAFSCYHAFNGLYTSLITWGLILKDRIRVKALRLFQLLMVLVATLGFAAIWLTYWITLKT